MKLRLVAFLIAVLIGGFVRPPQGRPNDIDVRASASHDLAVLDGADLELDLWWSAQSKAAVLGVLVENLQPSRAPILGSLRLEDRRATIDRRTRPRGAPRLEPDPLV